MGITFAACILLGGLQSGDFHLVGSNTPKAGMITYAKAISHAQSFLKRIGESTGTAGSTVRLDSSVGSYDWIVTVNGKSRVNVDAFTGSVRAYTSLFRQHDIHSLGDQASTKFVSLSGVKSNSLQWRAKLGIPISHEAKEVRVTPPPGKNKKLAAKLRQVATFFVDKPHGYAYLMNRVTYIVTYDPRDGRPLTFLNFTVGATVAKPNIGLDFSQAKSRAAQLANKSSSAITDVRIGYTVPNEGAYRANDKQMPKKTVYRLAYDVWFGNNLRMHIDVEDGLLLRKLARPSSIKQQKSKYD